MKIITAKKQDEVAKRLARILRMVNTTYEHLPEEQYCELIGNVTDAAVEIALAVGDNELVKAVGKAAFGVGDDGEGEQKCN